jgi:hypothetical protein
MLHWTFLIRFLKFSNCLCKCYTGEIPYFQIVYVNVTLDILYSISQIVFVNVTLDILYSISEIVCVNVTLDIPYSISQIVYANVTLEILCDFSDCSCKCCGCLVFGLTSASQAQLDILLVELLRHMRTCIATALPYFWTLLNYTVDWVRAPSPDWGTEVGY